MAEERLSPMSHDYVELLFHWHRYQIAAEMLKGLRVLDLGIGTAYGTAYLAQYAEHVTGIDIDSSAVNAAKLQYPLSNVTFVTGDIVQLHFDAESFDAVVMFEVIEHIPKEQHQAIFDEIRRILKPDGLFLMSTPDHDRTKHFAEKNPYHIGELTEPELSELLTRTFHFHEIYFQEINAASIVWQPAESEFRGYGLQIVEGYSQPAPLDHHTRLSLIAQASNVPLKHSLASFCAEYNRHVLTELWDHIGNAEWRLRLKQDEEEQYRQKIEELNQTIHQLQGQIEQANRDINIISETLLTIHHTYKEHLDRLAELEQSVQQMDELRQKAWQLQHELDIVYQSRSWKLIKKYWNLMDSPGLGQLLRAFRRFLGKLRRLSSSSKNRNHA
ncbi:class I SAM-dependent methyltransferase [Sulfobacillus thermosulfidooxidans]|uniref:class I SAM-dependent methyltransferase n=1 Tax=Sulfobacillus thermosulfidooxidans TaxID=28034 RepID=UPI0002E94C2D|nr:class I SAM-dependent methyltransferase [Sulfobacillus thermosulfidooxidans]